MRNRENNSNNSQYTVRNGRPVSVIGGKPYGVRTNYDVRSRRWTDITSFRAEMALLSRNDNIIYSLSGPR